MHYLYITTNKLDNKKYIGQRKCPINIKPENDNYLGSGTKLLYAIKKYGKDLFSKEIIAICKKQSKIDQLEILMINKLNVLSNKNEWYNIDAGGQYNRSENHSKLISKTMKQLYSTKEGRNKVINGINRSRKQKGLELLSYNNYDEYLIYKKECFYINKIRNANKRKIKKIKNLKKQSRCYVRQLYKQSDYYKNMILERGRKANLASTNHESIKLRKQSQRKAWNKRKKTETIWTDKNKKAFAIGKLKQYDNPIGLYLINNNVCLRLNRITSKVKKLYQTYKDESNRIKQIDNIINTIKSGQNIIIDRDMFIKNVYQYIDNQ